MNEIQVFNNDQFGQVRTVWEGDKVLFSGTDAARALGYSNPNKAVIDHCREDGVTKREVIDSMGRTQQAKFITEGNLYRLIMHSKLPSADRFERWVIDEVLPTIRKHGAYATDDTIEKILGDPDFGIRLLGELKQEREARRALEAQNIQMQPKALFADAVSASKTSILVGELARLLKQNGVDIGQNRLFEELRSQGYLVKRKGSDYNMPTQRSVERGWFEIKETCITHADGHTSVNKTPKVTGKGQVYFINLFLGKSAG